MSFSMTAPRSLRELFDQLGLVEIPSTDRSVTMEMPVDERTVNTAGGLQGGLVATMADVTAGQLAARVTPFGHAIATTDLFIRYLRPIKVGPGAGGRAHPAHRQALRRRPGRHLSGERRPDRCDGDGQLRRRRLISEAALRGPGQHLADEIQARVGTPTCRTPGWLPSVQRE